VGWACRCPVKIVARQMRLYTNCTTTNVCALSTAPRRYCYNPRMNPGKLTVVVGLPGSGKSTLVKERRCGVTGLCIEDFHANAYQDSPLVENSRHYRALIGHCAQGTTASLPTLRSAIRNVATLCTIASLERSHRWYRSGFTLRTRPRNANAIFKDAIEPNWRMI
jgi:hypothetical protein